MELRDTFSAIGFVRLPLISGSIVDSTLGRIVRDDQTFWVDLIWLDRIIEPGILGEDYKHELASMTTVMNTLEQRWKGEIRIVALRGPTLRG